MSEGANRFVGKVALVTGAGSGIGRATCLLLAREGASVLGVSKSAEGLVETSRMIRDSCGKFEFGVADVSTRAPCVDVVQLAVDLFGRLDVLLNVAGVAPLQHMMDVSESEWNNVLATNASSVFFLSQAALPHLLETDGNIVNVASNAGVQGQAYGVAYCASKGAVVQITRSMAMEYMKKRVRINCICPAGTRARLVEREVVPDEIHPQLFGRFVPARGLAAPEDMASAIAFLASEEARSFHGSVVNVDRGLAAG